MFWTFAALLTALTVLVILYPLSRKAKNTDSADAYDLTVYKSQLKEIDSDVEKGLIAESEADAARAEVARRLLKTQEALDAEKAPSDQSSKSSNIKIASVVALLVIPICSLGLYFTMGSPSLEGQPLAERLTKAPDKQTLIERVASVERVLNNNPDDLRGWKLLAPIYMTMRRPNDAISAYQNIIRLEGENADNLSDLGEAIVVGESGVVSPKAVGVFLRANKLQKKAPKPRFFLAIALGQQDKNVEAINAWQALINDSKPDSAWVPFAKEQIASLNKKISASSGTKPQATTANETTTSGPTKEDMEAAAQLSPEERKEMIQNMVTQLAERLEEEGGSAEDWVRLIRAELVLKRPDMAAKTVTKALKALQSDVEGLEKIKAAAGSLGLSTNQ